MKKLKGVRRSEVYYKVSGKEGLKRERIKRGTLNQIIIPSLKANRIATASPLERSG
jgi:hypothetical protein